MTYAKHATRGMQPEPQRHAFANKSLTRIMKHVAKGYCLHLQLYRDSKDRYKNGQTKASLSLQHFLGVESGFTLDKESNTIAIICQDVIVVLAFDTRERLIQWQVKISNNLGDDLQYLVLVSSAPPKAKLSTGPARMHIQDHRFCLTTGVPPRLTGLWQIEHLRRYGVVDNRFCFEGGSSCGKGEGLYVFVTDLGEEITHTFKLASQGKLASKKRATARKIAALDSPRKGAESRSTNYNDEICTVHIENSSCTCRNSYWPSTESRDLDSNYGCGDTASVSECHDSINDLDSFPRSTVANLERCMSCISKLGAPSMSRSSTVTGTPGAVAPLPAWHMMTEHNNHINQTHKLPTPQLALDRMSLCSHGSSNNSEYSIPRQTCGAGESSWYEKAPSQQTAPICNHHLRSTSPCSCNCPSVPCRPPKPRDISLHITAPLHTAISMSTGKTPHQQQHSVGPYENYDVPKTPIAIDGSSSACTPGENYDTPKKIQEYLSKEGKDVVDGGSSYGNYDMPMSLTKAVCSCLSGGGNTEPPVQPPMKGPDRVDCTCHRVMSWADNWISLPLCKRGNGIENTTVQVNKVKLSGEGKMPVMDASGAGDGGGGAIYATVDMTKKIRKKLEQVACACEEPLVTQPQASGPKQLPASCYDNYEDVEIKPETAANYANLAFEKSLENYENSKEVLQRAGLCLAGAPSDEEEPRVCHKCGHPSAKTPDTEENNRPEAGEQTSADDKQENYMMMEPGNKKSKFPGYIPMSPAAPSGGNGPEPLDGTISPTAPPLPSKSELLKQRMSRIIGEKSASNPSLSGPAVDRSRKRIDDESRVPGSAMLRATLASPYARKQLMDSSDLLPSCGAEKRLSPRKRSASAESSRFLDAEGEEIESPLSGTTSPSTETLLRKTPTPSSTTALRRSSSPCVHQEMESSEKTLTVAEPEDDLSASTNPASSQTSQSVYIRRSESVPCKAQNRDSSSSNDSGVSTGSLRQRGTDFTDFELPLTTAMSARRHQRHILPTQNCVHASLPRRSKSFDPLRELSFQFQKVRVPEKSTSAEAEVPVCPPKAKDVMASVPGAPYIDSRSTSSGTSDMSDYIETLSLSSHSSSDTPEGMRHIRQATSTLRPRSGKEYQNIDRSILSLTQASTDAIKVPGTPSQLRGLLSCSANYANITPVPENAESPSPGYQSGTSPQDAQGQHFMFKNSS
uniref:IRS-type PTB domain-containing protein n=1 Tax=Anopheles culicifacies TaxID=139723 RepID=A0A182MGA2_9DIPT